MGKKAIEYNEENLATLERSVHELRLAQDVLAACVGRPEQMTFADWQLAADNYRAALEDLKQLPDVLLQPEDIEDPADIRVTELLKALKEQEQPQRRRRKR